MITKFHAAICHYEELHIWSARKLNISLDGESDSYIDKNLMAVLLPSLTLMGQSFQVRAQYG